MLEGITADDYLPWVRDPEPLALGMSLRSVAVSAAPIGDRIEVELCWDDTPPPIRSAAFPPTPEVTLRAAGEAQSPNGHTMKHWTPARRCPTATPPANRGEYPGPCR